MDPAYIYPCTPVTRTPRFKAPRKAELTMGVKFFCLAQIEHLVLYQISTCHILHFTLFALISTKVLSSTLGILDDRWAASTLNIRLVRLVDLQIYRVTLAALASAHID